METTETNDEAAKPEAANSATEDLAELRDTVQGTYEELQLTLQKQEEPDQQASVQTSAAALNLAMGASLRRINEIAQDPKLLGDDRDGAIEALAKLTWYLLRIAPFLGNPNQAILVARSTGAVVESLSFDERLITSEHCGFLFHCVGNYLRTRQQLIDQGQPTEPIDRLVQAFCPPLMVYFSKRLDTLAKLREEESDVVECLQVWQRPIAMIRRLLLQAIDETILLAWVEKDANSKLLITYAQRVQFTGLYVNKDLVEWVTNQSSELDEKFAEAGESTEMASWTGLRDTEEGILCGAEEVAIKPHRIYQEGIPNDIPTLDGERIVLCYAGKIRRKMSGKVFPLVDLEASKEGHALSKVELIALSDKIEKASVDDVEAALNHQMQRGSNDDMIQQTIVRLKMGSIVVVDALN